MRIFDTHAHYSDEKYDIDRETLFRSMKSFGVDRVTLIGASLEESKREKEIAIKYSGVSDVPRFYYTVGDHPDEILKCDPESAEGVAHIDALKRLTIDDGKVTAVAIGEIGLDYYGDFKTEVDFDNQKRWFKREIELARELNLPIVVHSREACFDTLDYIKKYAKGLSGIIHCFAYEKEIALEYVRLGFYIGIGGVLTFKNARKTKEVVAAIGLENIVAETDSPWLSPTPHRGERNNSSYIKYVIDEIASIKNMSIDIVAEKLYDNAKKVYNLTNEK